MDELSDDILFLIGDQLILPDFLNLSFTCQRIYQVYHRTTYRRREKIIYCLHEPIESCVYMAAQANIPLLLKYYFEQWTSDTDFWMQVGLGAAVGGHLELVKQFFNYSTGNAADVLAAAIRYKHHDICNYLLTKKVLMNEESTYAIAQTGNTDMFVKMISHDYYIPLRDFPVLCIHGFDQKYPRKRYYAIIMFALQNSPKDFMTNLFDALSDDEDDMNDYYKIISYCLQGPHCIIDYLTTCGFNNWIAACIAAMMNYQSSGLFYFSEYITKITDINLLKPIVKYAVENELKDFLIICEHTFPNIKNYIIKTCKKYDKSLLQYIFDIDNLDIS